MTDTSNKFVGRKFLVKIQDPATPGTYKTIAGMRATSWTLSQGGFDVTDKDNMPWTQMIVGGIAKLAISLGGVFKDAASLQYLQALLFANPDGSILPMQVVSDNGDTLTGPFFIKSLALTGPHTSEETYTMSLESAGDIVFVAPAPIFTSALPSPAAAGGALVTILGNKFQLGATLMVAAAPCACVVVDGQHITFTAPAHATGAAALIITNPDMQSITGSVTYV